MQPEISFATSNKGKPLLVCNRYVFKCNKTTSSKKYWVCNERTCGVYVHTNMIDEFLSINGTHNHVAEPDQLEVKLLREKMKERIVTETTSLTRIYDEEVAKATLSKAATAGLPTVIEFRMFS